MLKRVEQDKAADEAAERAQRLREAIALQEIEGNPPTPEQVAMFEMFEREGWSFEKRRAYILKRYQQLA